MPAEKLADTAESAKKDVVTSLPPSEGQCKAVFPKIDVDPKFWDFANLHLNVTEKRVQLVTITNIGDAPLTVQSITPTGDTSDVVVTGDALNGIVLGPGKWTELTLSCKPLSVGVKRIDFEVASDATNVTGPVAVRAIAMAGQPVIALSPPSKDYGKLGVAKDTRSGDFTITNTGTWPLTLGDIEIEGDRGDFTWPDLKGRVVNPISESSGNALVFQIGAKTTEPGKRSATAKIISDAVNGPASLSVTAIGTQPKIAVDAPSHDFGRLVKSRSLVHTFKITNPGTAPLTITGIALREGTHYSITGARPSGTVILQPLKDDSRAILSVEITAKPGTGSIEGIKLDSALQIDSDAVNRLEAVTLTTVAILPTVSIQQAPYVAVSNKARNRDKALRAIGTPADLGQYTWTISDTAKVRFKTDNPRNATPTASGLTPGTARITVVYSIGDVASAPATIDFHVVDVTITEAPTLSMDCSGDPIVPLPTVHAVGVPAGGTPVWQAITNNRVRYGAGTTTVANLDADVEPRGEGAASAAIKYTYPTDGGGATAEAKIDFNVRLLRCTNVNWAPAGAGITANSPRTFCTHLGTRQRPNSGIAATDPAAYPHHHGETCLYCKVDGKDVYHFITPDTGCDAANEVAALHGQMHALRAMFPGNWVDGVSAVPLNAAGYIAQHPWLNDVPVWLYDPAGYTPPCSWCATTGNCNRCGGTTHMPCLRCGGAGATYPNCTTCGATGTVTCGRCGGTGAFVQACRACGGRGRGCRTCRGTGEYRGTCNGCNGARNVQCRGCGGTGRRNFTCNGCSGNGWLICNLCADGTCTNCGGAGYLAQQNNGKMIGVVVGVDGTGLRHVLRGASGTFPGGHATAKGMPNAYWARSLENNSDIYSASRNLKSYPAYDRTDTQFGRCAASRLLTYALHLGLRVDSMAEIWIGGGGHTDGQLVTSCDYCRIYLHHMLCDRGGNARGNPYPGNANTPPNRGLLVTITEEPRLNVNATQTTPITLHAVAVPASPTATYAWTIANTGVVNYSGARDGATLQASIVGAGTTAVQVVYTLGTQVKQATVQVVVT